jgi:hypothetical protein
MKGPLLAETSHSPERDVGGNANMSGCYNGAEGMW